MWLAAKDLLKINEGEVKESGAVCGILSRDKVFLREQMWEVNGCAVG